MSLKHLIVAQAKLMTGELDARKAVLLEVLCGTASDFLEARLKEGLCPEDCAEAFVAAASLHAVSDFYDADDSAAVEEFKAGDLTVKKGSPVKGASGGLRQQAENVMRPYLKDGFCFSGV